MTKRSGSDKRQRTKSVCIRLTPAEYEAVARLAQAQNATVPTLFRNAIGRYAEGQAKMATDWIRALGAWQAEIGRVERA